MGIKSDARLLEEWTSFLHRVNIFSELEQDALREVAKKLRPLSLPKGTHLFKEGDPGDALYIIQSGRVQIVAQQEQGREKVLNYLGRGETLGETSLLTGAPRVVTARVESTSHFLALYRKDFEQFLKKNPTVFFYISRFISQRFLAAGKRSVYPETRSELIGLVSELETEDHLLFMVNFGVGLTEQTRRKTLLLNLHPLGPRLVESLGMKPIHSSSRMLSPEDLQSPKLLEKLTHVHPSGLEILNLPPEIFMGILSRTLPAFLDTLRNLYDYTLICLPSPDGADAVPRALLRECDSAYYVFSDDSRGLPLLEQYFQEEAKSQDATRPIWMAGPQISGSTFNESAEQKLKTIYLDRGVSLAVMVPDFTVPWHGSVFGSYRKTGRPYITGYENEATHRALSRLARSIGKLLVGLAMGSGAAYGYTLVGILRVFEREKIPMDFISGTSMGALLGSFYASGKTVDEVDALSQSITKVWLRRNILSDLNLPWPHGGILMGRTISKFLRGVLGDVEFKDMPVPFACVATDIMTGDAVVFREGKVWEGVRSSLSLPLIFCPYKMGNRFLVDGGLVNPVPTSLIASMGADVLISVNLTSKVSEKKVSLRRLGMFPAKSPGLANIFFKMIYTMQYQIAQARMDLSHIIIRPNTRNFSWTDFHKAKQIMPIGEEAAEEVLPKVKGRLPFFADYCRMPLGRKPTINY